MSGAAHRRWPFAAGLALLLGAATAGYWVAIQIAPRRLAEALEARIEAWVGPVEIGRVRLRFLWGPTLEATELRTTGGSEAGPAGPGPPGHEDGRAGAGLRADRLRVSLDLPTLLRGRARIGRISVSGLDVDLARKSNGELLRPAAAARLLRAIAAPAERAAGSQTTHAGDDPFKVLRRASGELPSIDVEQASVRIREAAPSGGAGAVSGIEELRLALDRGALSRSLQVEAAGRLVTGDRSLGRLEIEAALPVLGDPALTLAIAGLDLAAARIWAEQCFGARARAVWPDALSLAGNASARIEWQGERAGAQRGSFELLVLDLRASAAGAARPIRAALPSGRLRGALGLAGDSLRLDDLEIALGPLQASGEARLGLPWRKASSIDLELTGSRVQAQALRDAALHLLPDAAGELRRTLQQITAGSLESWSVRVAQTKRGDLQGMAGAPLERWPSGLAFEAEVRGVELALAGGDPLRELGGSVALDGDHVELRGVSARIGDRPLPALTLSLRGLRAVLAALQSSASLDAVAPLPGRMALDEWVEAQKKPGEPPRWKHAEVDLEWLRHPALLRPLERVRATLEPTQPGLRIEIAEARWGGVGVSGRLRTRGKPTDRLEVDLTASLPYRAPAPPADPGAWSRGALRVDLEKLGPLRAEVLTGQLRAVGPRIELREAEAKLLPRGALRGELDLDLSERAFVPYRADLRLDDGSVPDLLLDLHLEPEAMTGSAALAGKLGGRLVPRTELLTALEGPVSLELTRGEIRQRMGLLFAIAAASDSLNPFRSRETLPYDRIDAELVFERGIIRAQSMNLTGPAVRLVGTGSVDAATAPHEMQAVMGLFFFEAIDRVIGSVPLVNWLLLGPDKNLVGAYFALEGPWKQPHARVIPTKSLRSGPASIVTEGLPSFVKGGLSALGRLVGAAPAPPPATPPRVEAAPGDADPAE